MKKRLNYRILALLLALTIGATMLFACTGKAPAETSTKASSEASSETSSETTGAVSKEQNSMPIVESPIEIKVFIPLNAKVGNSLLSYGDMECMKKIEEITGIKVKWIHPSVGQEKEQFNLMMASNELPDVLVWGLNEEKGGPSRFIGDNIIVKLNDLVNDNAPNLKKLYTDIPGLLKQTILDDGTMYQFPVVRTIKETGKWYRMYGPMVRRDWLDNLGLKPPKTIDELYNVLTEFKDKDANGNGDVGDEIPFISSKDSAFRFLLSAWGINYGFYQDMGKVKYGPIEPAYKEYLATMNKWFDEGLIDSEFALVDAKNFNTRVTGDKAGVFFGWTSGNMGNYLDLMKDQNTKFDLQALPWFEGPAGKSYTTHIDYIRLTSGAGACITSACKYPVETTRWMDFMYSQQGHMLLNYGIEGESYTIDNGVPKYTDKVMKNPDGLSVVVASSLYTTANIGFPMIKDPIGYEQLSWNWPQQKESHVLWDAADTSLIFPEVSLTIDESTKVTAVLGQVNTYADEMLTKFIMGVEPISNFDKYVETIKKMGIDEVLQINQAAMERFNNRK